MSSSSWPRVRQEEAHDAGLSSETGSLSSSCVAPELQRIAPVCSAICIETFILNNYADISCSSASSLDYLCTTATSSGLTIGEGTLQCILSSCSGGDFFQRGGYNVCAFIPGAIPNTASTITVTVTAGLSSQTPSWSSTDQYPTSTSLSSSGSTGSVSASGASTVTSEPTMSAPTTFRTDPSEVTSVTSTSSITATSSSQITSQSSTTSTGEGVAQTPGTSMPATNAPERKLLSTGAVTGISIGSVIALFAIMIVVACLFLMRRKRRDRNHNLQSAQGSVSKLSGDSSSPTVPAMLQRKDAPSLANMDNVIIGSNSQLSEGSKNYWRGSTVPYNDIGVAYAASTRISPEPIVKLPARTQAPMRPRRRDSDRWSRATSFDEDVEAQRQETQILGSPGRSTTRNFPPVERPAPLRLSKIKPREGASNLAGARIPLTPVYDNGTFERTIRQVYDDDTDLTTQRQQESSQIVGAMNFSRREPSLTRTSREQSLQGPRTHRRRESISQDRNTSRPLPEPRKESQSSAKSTSMHTDFEEDSTPEHEEDRELVPQLPPGVRTLRDLRYPPIPLSRAVAKQATRPHSPRVAFEKASASLSQPEPNEPDHHDLLINRGRTFYQSNTTSSEDQSNWSLSPVFPLPPTQRASPGTHKRNDAKTQNNLQRQISDAIRAASRPTTATTDTTSAYVQTTSPPRPGEMYSQIQRMSANRASQSRSQSRMYMGPQQLTRQPTVRTPRKSGDLYFMVSD